MTRALAALVLSILFSGCGPGHYLVGGQIYNGPAPADASESFTVPTCESTSVGGLAAGPAGFIYYLVKGGTSPVLYEIGPSGSALVTNHWAEADGDHFFMYVRMSHAWHFVFPKDASQPAIRYAYEANGAWNTVTEGAVIKPSGTPSWKCLMVEMGGKRAEEARQGTGLPAHKDKPEGEMLQRMAAGKKIILAVFSIEDRGANLGADVRERLSDYLTSTIASSGKFQVIPRSILKERLNLQKTDSYKECFDQSCQIELGKELAAEKSLSTQIIRLGSACTVTAVIYDLKTSASEGGADSEGSCNEEGIAKSLKAVVSGLTRSLEK